MIDDYDIWYSIKNWAGNPDFVLSFLSRGLMDRRLLKVNISNQPMENADLEKLRIQYQNELGISHEDATYLVFEKEVSNSAYISGGGRIGVKTRNGEVLDVANATDLPNIHAMTQVVKKYIICQPKTISLRTFL